MLADRIKVAIVLVLILAVFISIGSWPYTLLIAAMLGLAAWEYARIFEKGGFRPSKIILVAGTFLLALTRGAWGFAYQDAILALLTILTLASFTWRYEHGQDNPGSNFAITLSGLLYLGWLGSYQISLRDIPNGLWWTLIAIPAASAADGGAFFIGGLLGRHPMSQRTSPNKTWEGYIGGVLVGTLAGLLLAYLWHFREPSILPLQGLIIGFVVTALAPLGDLAESMIKRQFQVKDSGTIFPGHGGMMDRIDTWIYASVISYYMIQLIW